MSLFALLAGWFSAVRTEAYLSGLAGQFNPVEIPSYEPWETKARRDYCWRVGCNSVSVSPSGLCRQHIEEMKSW